MNQGQLTETDYMNLLAEWDTVKKQKDALVAKERAPRSQLTGHFFPNTMDKATQYQPIGNGYRLKCEGGIEYGIDKGELALFSETETNAAELIASCIRYKPELDKRN